MAGRMGNTIAWCPMPWGMKGTRFVLLTYWIEGGKRWAATMTTRAREQNIIGSNSNKPRGGGRKGASVGRVGSTNSPEIMQGPICETICSKTVTQIRPPLELTFHVELPANNM